MSGVDCPILSDIDEKIVNKKTPTYIPTYRRDASKRVEHPFSIGEKSDVRGGGRLVSPCVLSWSVVDREIGCNQRISSAFSKSSRVHGRSNSL